LQSIQAFFGNKGTIHERSNRNGAVILRIRELKSLKANFSMNPKIVLKKVLIKLIMLITIQGIIGVYCRLFCIDPKIFIPIFLEG
jgi:hypothetical protein